MNKKALNLLPLLFLAVCCSKNNDSEKSYESISFEQCEFTGDNHNNLPASNEKSGYTEMGATFIVENVYYMIGGILVADNCEKPVVDADYYNGASDKCVVNNALEEGEEGGTYGAGGSAKYSIWAYNSYMADMVPGFSFDGGVTRKIVSLEVNNVAQYWQRMKIGYYSKPAFSDGDWFDAIFTGYDAAGKETGMVVVPMADFRNGKSFIMDTWTEVDMTALGEVNKVVLNYDASDAFLNLNIGGSYSICVDNIKFEVSE